MMRIVKNWKLYLELEQLVMTNSGETKRINELRSFFDGDKTARASNRLQAYERATHSYETIEASGKIRQFVIVSDLMTYYTIGAEPVKRCLRRQVPISRGRNKGLLIREIPKIKEMAEIEQPK